MTPRRPSIFAAFYAPAVATALGLLLACPAGCTTYKDFSAFAPTTRPLASATEYRLGPPDSILITSKVVREVNNHEEQIRPDGKITLPLVGSVFIAGKTCDQISNELQERYRDFYRDADISLRVSAFRSKRIYVFGEVGVPGPYEYTGANTVLGTMAQAQPSRLADTGRIDVLRPSRDGALVRRMTIDLDDMIKRGDTTHDAVLEEGDIIYVHANALASVGLALQQLLLPIQPAAATVKGPADIGGNVSGRSPYNGQNVTPQ
jgi:polysaccharide export outer membrane protein